MAVCHNCGAQLPLTGQVCPYCGAKRGPGCAGCLLLLALPLCCMCIVLPFQVARDSWSNDKIKPRLQSGTDCVIVEYRFAPSDELASFLAAGKMSLLRETKGEELESLPEVDSGVDRIALYKVNAPHPTGPKYVKVLHKEYSDDMGYFLERVFKGTDIVEQAKLVAEKDGFEWKTEEGLLNFLAWDSTRKRPTTIHYDVFVRVDGENYIIPLDKEEPFDADNAVEYLNAGGWISPLFNP